MGRRAASFCIGSGLALAAAFPGVADPRLDEVVYSPYVQNGVGEFEARGAQALGGSLDGAMTTVFEGEYGVSDRLSLATVTTVDRAAGEGARLAGIGLESIYYLGRIPRVGIDTGLYLEYTHGLTGDGDVAEGKLLLAKTAGRFQGLVNLIVEEPIAAPSGHGYAGYGYAVSATWQAWGALRLGAESFGDFGDDHAFLGRQGAYVGPQVKWEGRLARLPVDLGIDAGWLKSIGTSRAEADSEARIALELEHRF
ncbi:MAG: hypothetical protein ABI056_00040 [Caulobacteraceae bacterium]